MYTYKICFLVFFWCVCVCVCVCVRERERERVYLTHGIMVLHQRPENVCIEKATEANDIHRLPYSDGGRDRENSFRSFMLIPLASGWHAQ